jgi:hypothetical protein
VPVAGDVMEPALVYADDVATTSLKFKVHRRLYTEFIHTAVTGV